MPYLVDDGSLSGRLIAGSAGAWDRFTRHAFVAGLQDGSLPEAAFRHYLVQDYLFLVHFARAWALAALKAEDIRTIRECAATLHALIDEEMQLHIAYCRGFGLDEAAMAATPEHPANVAYTRYVMERGLAGDLLDLLTALAPCVIGYGEIAARLVADPATRLDGNPYRAWIETYAGADYRGVAMAAAAQLKRVAAARIGSDWEVSPRWPALQHTFTTATELEVGFWQMGLDAH